MAEAIDFEGATHHIGPPPGLEEQIGWLHCFRNGSCVVSAWKFSPEELAELNRNGGVAFLSVRSGAAVFPVFVGTERIVASVVADEGKVWNTKPKLKPTDHASTSPGPVNCNTVLQAQGKAYPRTCERCGLGPCPFFDVNGNAKQR